MFNIVKSAIKIEEILKKKLKLKWILLWANIRDQEKVKSFI